MNKEERTEWLNSFKEERTEWLNSLNIGDEITYRTGGAWIGDTIAKITRITPKRMFRLSNGSMVNADGSVRGNKYFYIHPVTDKVRMNVWRNKAIHSIRENLKIEKLSNEQLKVLMEMLKSQSE